MLFFFFFTKSEEMARVGSRDRHPRWRSKNTQLNELPCSRVDLILLHTALFHQMAQNANNADPRGLGICIGVLICGAIVKSEKCGRIQCFLIQYYIHLLFQLVIHVCVI